MFLTIFIAYLQLLNLSNLLTMKAQNLILIFLASLFFASCRDVSKPILEADYAVIPLPQNVTKIDAKPFILSGHDKIVYPKGDEVQKQTAEFLSEYISFNTGIDLIVTDIETDQNAIVLKADYKGEKAESYQLTVTDKLIIINGADKAGTFYGVQTLRKSIPANAKLNSIVFPAVDIQDYPRFEYRGMMLDAGRHIFPVEFVKKYIDILALNNINQFHLGLTQDQGWRIEIKSHPELTKIGSQREQTVIGNNTGKYDGTPYGGFYTQDEVKDLVAYAQKRFINIIPEINFPGHTLAVLATYPNLGCTGGPYKVGQDWGVLEDVLCPGNDSIYTFLEDVLSEVVELFPSPYIHIGGDECPKVRWKECPKCQAKIKELGIKSDAKHSKEDKLQSYVMTRMENFLTQKGRHVIGWDEILEGGLGPNATVMSWRGMDGGIAAAQQAHDVIMTPNNYVYFDYYQTEDVENEPIAIGGYVPLEKVYSLDPIPSSLTDDQKKHIIGVQANLWTEYITTTQQVEYMTLPRIAALAEVQWTMPEKKDYKTFLPRLGRMIDLYKELGYNYATHIAEISGEVEKDTINRKVVLSLFTYDNAPIYYTTDGSEPSEKSTLYSQPIQIGSTTNVKAVAIRKDGQSKIYNNSFSFNKATMKDLKLGNNPHRTYTFQGATTLVDGKRGRANFNSGEWLGFVDSDFVATVDLKEPTDISEVVVGTYLEPSSWLFGATEYSVQISNDGKIFKTVFNKKYPILDKGTQDHSILDLVASFEIQKARFVKLILKPTKSMPSWHDGKGKPAFLFIDEIIIN